ncbi:MAG TPA: SEC-C metal-binding domain-containing protein [Stellaceae bacterium]|jgi:tetratricopeptide (TPR) repeat protein|nr:SEC-C metal-binding domain-containing protein [Stellaceae bacterium]
MAKIGRNEPCPCGSGKKYKRCCLAKDAKAEIRALAAAAPAAPPHHHLGFCDDCYAALAVASNAVLDLIEAGKLDDAEADAHALIDRFPDAHDGLARLGLVHELRGDHRQAVDCYRKVIAFIRERPDQYAPGSEDGYLDLIDRLAAAPAR